MWEGRRPHFQCCTPAHAGLEGGRQRGDVNAGTAGDGCCMRAGPQRRPPPQRLPAWSAAKPRRSRAAHLRRHWAVINSADADHAACARGEREAVGPPVVARRGDDDHARVARRGHRRGHKRQVARGRVLVCVAADAEVDGHEVVRRAVRDALGWGKGAKDDAGWGGGEGGERRGDRRHVQAGQGGTGGGKLEGGRGAIRGWEGGGCWDEGRHLHG